MRELKCVVREEFVREIDVRGLINFALFRTRNE